MQQPHRSCADRRCGRCPTHLQNGVIRLTKSTFADRHIFRVPSQGTRFGYECRVRGVRELLVALRPDTDEDAAPPASAGRRFGSCGAAADSLQRSPLRIDPSRLSRTEAHRRKQRCAWWPVRDAPAPTRAGLDSLFLDPRSDSSVTFATKKVPIGRRRCRPPRLRRGPAPAPGVHRATRVCGRRVRRR